MEGILGQLFSPASQRFSAELLVSCWRCWRPFSCGRFWDRQMGEGGAIQGSHVHPCNRSTPGHPDVHAGDLAAQFLRIHVRPLLGVSQTVSARTGLSYGMVSVINSVHNSEDWKIRDLQAKSLGPSQQAISSRCWKFKSELSASIMLPLVKRYQSRYRTVHGFLMDL